MNDDAHEDDGGARCPFCGSTGNCEHLLLVVDRTFRMAEGGVFMNAFNNRWSVICEEAGEDFDERQPFEDLLDEVSSLSDAMTDYDSDGAPGMSSACAIFFVESAAKAREAVMRFGGGGSRPA